MQTALSILGGIILLAFGGEFLVRGSVAAARRFGVSPLLISLIFVGFGTSAPELVTTVRASLAGTPDIAIGNIVGSNIANLLLALGTAALIAPIVVRSNALKRDGGLLLACVLGFAALSAVTPLSRPIGALLLAGLAAYVTIAYLGERLHRRAGRSAASSMGEAVGERLPPLPLEGKRVPMLAAAAMVALGLVGVLGGAGLLVEGALGMAHALSIPETVIGLSLVAVGTSLPELFTSAFAAWRKQPEVAFGNAIGSCIYNILGIGGVAAMVAPLSVPPQIVQIDNLVMVAATSVTVAFAWTGGRIARREGVLLLLGYAAYIAWLWPR
ncbi:MAG: calcium/sodium antiporter [Devosia sp.]